VKKALSVITASDSWMAWLSGVLFGTGISYFFFSAIIGSGFLFFLGTVLFIWSVTGRFGEHPTLRRSIDVRVALNYAAYLAVTAPRTCQNVPELGPKEMQPLIEVAKTRMAVTISREIAAYRDRICGKLS